MNSPSTSENFQSHILGGVITINRHLSRPLNCTLKGVPDMKRTVFILPALLVLALIIASCAQATPAPSSAETSGTRYKIGFANLTEDIVFTKLVREGIERKAQEMGNIDLVLADNKLDGATALANAENFITQGVQGVVEFQTDEQFGNVIMDKFRRNNIPVIAIDIPMPGATFFGADNYQAGRLAGEGLAEYVKSNWDGQVDYILLLELPQSGPIPAARMQGMLEGLQENIPNPVSEDNIFRLDSKNTQEEARRVVGDTLPRIPADAHHIVAATINDGTALGTIAAFEAAGRRGDVKVIGQNADPSGWPELCKADPDNAYYGSTAYFPENYGDKIMPAIIDLIEGRPVPPSIYVDHVLITRDNINDYYPEACK
jgi:ribose transport system substrate-binding protein